MSNITWRIECDFDNDGFGGAGSGDDITQYVKQCQWQIGMREAYQYVADNATARFRLHNNDKRFSPEYASSPYFGKLLRGQRVQVVGSIGSKSIDESMASSPATGSLISDATHDAGGFVALSDGTASSSGAIEWSNTDLGEPLMLNFEYRGGTNSDVILAYWGDSGLATQLSTRGGTGGYCVELDDTNARVKVHYGDSELVSKPMVQGVQDGDWHRVSIETLGTDSGTLVRVYHDGNEIIHYVDSARGVGSGVVGIGAQNSGAGDTQDLRRVVAWANGAEVVMWRGFVTAWRADHGNMGQEASIDASCAKQFLESSKAVIPLFENATADDAVTWAVSNVQQPASQNGFILGRSTLGRDTVLGDLSRSYAIEQGVTTFSYIGDAIEEDAQSAMSVVSDVVQGERGRLFFDRDGKLVFWNRHHLLRRRDSIVTISNPHDMRYVYGESEKNVVRVNIRPRALSAGSNETLYTSDREINIKAGEARIIRARFRDEDNKEAQIGGRDLTVPTLANGNLAYTGGNVTVSMEAKARSVEITLENSGTTDANVTTLIVKGQKLTSYNTLEIVEQNQAQMARGRSELVIDARCIDDENYGRSIAKYELGRRSIPAGEVQSVGIIERNEDDAKNMLLWRVGDRVAINEARTAHNGEHFVMGEAHRLDVALHQYSVDYYFEPAASNVFWVLGVSTLGNETKLAV